MAVRTGEGAKGLSLSEQELIRRAKQGDKDAFCELAQSYERRLFSLALHYCRDAHDAEDLSQEVWLKAYRAIGGFRGDSSFYTWLRRIAVNSFLNHRRDSKATTGDKVTGAQPDMKSLDDAYELPDERAASVEEAAYHKQLVTQVTQAMEELTPQQRLIFLLKHREEMSCEEISEACAVSTGTVKKSLFRAVGKIRERMGIATGAKEQPSVVRKKA
jgi:RNA polymerase sigma-70 factor (ECF subfamily)